MKFRIKYVLLFLLVIGLLMGAYEGIWKQGAKKVDYELPIEEDENVFIEVVWDASGSMWGRINGEEKIKKSKEILNTIVDKFPEEINMGLRIFGARRVGDLEDSFLAVALNKDQRQYFYNFVSNIKPLGKSPIAYSLNKAREDLEKVNGEKYILLISDGIDNGDFPPEKVIDELSKKGIVLYVIHTGELDNYELKNKLKKYARATGGDYFTYREDKELIPIFKSF